MSLWTQHAGLDLWTSSGECSEARSRGPCGTAVPPREMHGSAKANGQAGHADELR